MKPCAEAIAGSGIGSGLGQQERTALGPLPESVLPKTCHILAVSADSPLARHLREIVGPVGILGFVHQPASGPASWRRAVSGTALQWFSGPDSKGLSDGAGSAGIVLDLSGAAGAVGTKRLWRIRDSEGRPLLQPFAGLTACHRPPFVASLTLTEQAPGGIEVRLAEAHVSTRRPYRDLLDRMAQIAGLLLRAALLGPSDPVPYAPAQACQWGARAIAQERLRVAAAAAVQRWRSRLTSEKWAIGELRCPVEAVLNGTAPAPRWITSPSLGSYIADPFPWPGRPDVILCERFDERSARGDLVALSGPKGDAIGLDVGLKCHLSYPFTWAENGRVFCVPESSAARQTIIYELDSAGMARPYVVVDTGRAVSDPTIFRHEGRYWLAYSDSDLGMHDTLCLFHAERLEGPWTPHRRNPVKIDIRSARPGGTPFRIGGELYRPAQDCSLTYGGALAINRVVTCTPESYEEVVETVLRPDPHGPYPDGLHTLSLAGDVILIDGKRLQRSPLTLAGKLAARLRPRK